jgi:hypothetical protein
VWVVKFAVELDEEEEEEEVEEEEEEEEEEVWVGGFVVGCLRGEFKCELVLVPSGAVPLIVYEKKER